MPQFLGWLGHPGKEAASENLIGLSKGLGDFFLNYTANKKLEDISNSPDFKNAPLSDKFERLSSGLQGFGEAGQKALQRKLMAEQHRQQETQQKTLAKVFEKFQKGEELDQKDMQGVPPEQQFKFLEAQNQRLKQTQEVNKQKRQFETGNKLAKQLGRDDLVGLDLKPEQILNTIKASQTKESPAEIKKIDSLEAYKSGQNVLQRMKQLRKKGNLGRFSSAWGFFPGETAKDRGEYEQLGKSLISLSTNIPIRNRLEFETLAHRLYDPSLPDNEAEGVLNAMERIIDNNIKRLNQTSESSQQETDKEKIKFDSKNPEHSKRAQEVLSSVNGNKAEANRILAEEFVR